MNLLSLALVVSLLVWTGRGLRRRWLARRHARRPGYSADRPLVLSSGRALDDGVAAARCVCGGQVRSAGETTRGPLRVVFGRCRSCEGDVELFFVLPHLLH